MSTRSTIVIKLRDEDLNRTLKVDKEFAKSHGLSEETIAKIGEVATKNDKPYLEIYCHHDGYPEHNGEVLALHYGDYEKVKNLVLCGNTSWIDAGATGVYVENEDWEDNAPERMEQAYPVSGDSEYIYVFEDGKWKFSELHWSYNYPEVKLAKALEWKDILKYLDKEI